jgi:hypothetical protein
MHGVFFQGGIGGGALIGSNGATSDTRTFTGMSLSWHVMVGGRLRDRWAFGAAYSREHVPSPSASDEVTDGDEPNLDNVTFSLDALTVFVDVHPSGEGFHAVGHLGFAGFAADRGAGTQSSAEAALAVILGAGYDHRLESGLTLGGLGQLTYVRPDLWEGQTLTRLNLLVPALLFTVAYR